jgi:hypothetical protein
MKNTHISAEKARQLAYSWHGGQWSALYAFASSGIIECHLALLGELRTCEALAQGPGYTITDRRNLRALYRFARDCLAKIPGDRFAAPWARLEAAR